MELFKKAVEYYKQGQYTNAINVFKMLPESGDVCKNIGLCYNSLKDKDSARSYFECSLRYKFEYPIAKFLITYYNQKQQYSLLFGLLQTFLYLYPDDVFGNKLLGDLYCITGHQKLGHGCFNRVNHLDPSIHYYINDYMNTIEKVKKPEYTSARQTSKIRIGYVGEVYNNQNHPMYSFVKDIIVNHDATKFKVFSYELGSQKIASAIEDIKKDNIDIIIDLLHPLSKWVDIYKHDLGTNIVSYCATPATSSNKHIHYKILDSVTYDKSIDPYYSENILCLEGGFHVFRPLYEFPVIQKQHHNTFNLCCFNNPIKITMDMIKTWLTILDELPNANLFLGYHYYSSDFIASKWSSIINHERVHFIHEKNITDMLNHYNMMDVALDTYPYNGTTITCEALSMNVPVVTRKGNFPHSRMGASILHSISCDELITTSKENYISTIIAMNDAKTRESITYKLSTNIHILHDINGFMTKYEHLLENI
jgi:predicted O-linked N-acetylglucosamine transferase (SPINDLY family)